MLIRLVYPPAGISTGWYIHRTPFLLLAHSFFHLLNYSIRWNLLLRNCFTSNYIFKERNFERNNSKENKNVQFFIIFIISNFLYFKFLKPLLLRFRWHYLKSVSFKNARPFWNIKSCPYFPEIFKLFWKFQTIKVFERNLSFIPFDLSLNTRINCQRAWKKLINEIDFY